VFFELNGHPRIVKVPNRSVAASAVVGRKAEDDNAAHVAAPMPGVISTVAVRAGDAVRSGDTLLTLEAMKMEMRLQATRDGVVEEVLARVGRSVEAKDLLIVFKS
jgi:pyruvate carboxylase